MYQKLLGSAALILVLHNALLLVLGTLSSIEMLKNLSQDVVSLLTWIGIDGLDIVGIFLLGVGLYGVSPAVPQGDRCAKKSGGLFLLWVLLTVIWRSFGRAAFRSRRVLTPHVWVYVFFLASLILAAAVYQLNTIVARLRGQRYSLEGDFPRHISVYRRRDGLYVKDEVGTLYRTYAGLNVLGVFLYTLAVNWEVFLGDPLAGLWLFFLVGFIKGVVVPLLGILVFAHLYRVCWKLDLSSAR